MAELVESRKGVLLHVDGYLYYSNGGKISSKAYWNCHLKPECLAR